MLCKTRDKLCTNSRFRNLPLPSGTTRLIRYNSVLCTPLPYQDTWTKSSPLFLFLRCIHLFLMSPAVLWVGAVSVKLCSLETWPYVILWLVLFGWHGEVIVSRSWAGSWLHRNAKTTVRRLLEGVSQFTSLSRLYLRFCIFFPVDFNIWWRFVFVIRNLDPICYLFYEFFAFIFVPFSRNYLSLLPN